MPLFPAVKLMDSVIGLDLHAVMIPPAPAPIPMLPHPYMGAIFLWNTPQFPAFSSGLVLINRFVNVGGAGNPCGICAE